MSPRRLALLALLATLGCSSADSPSADFEWGTFSHAIRPNEPGAIEPRYDPGITLDSVLSPGGGFRIHFARDGADAVPGADQPMPPYVAEVADVYDSSLAHYETLGFRAPLSDEQYSSGGDAAFDVFLVDFNRRGDGQYGVDICWGDAPSTCAGHMRHENDFAGYGYPSLRVAHEIIGSHELFHAVQAAYSSGEGAALSEGTAVWATEHYDSSLNDFEGFIDSYLEDTERSLDSEGGFDGWVYGAAIFFKFLSEAHDDDVIRELWEARGVEGRTDAWLESVDEVLRTRGTSFQQEFLRFSRWNLALGVRGEEETYAEADRYPAVSFRAETVPVNTGRLRVFPASMRVYSVVATGLSSARVQLVGRDAASIEDLVLVAGWRGSQWAPVVVPASDGFVDVPRPSSNVDILWVAIVDPRLEGSSRRPVVCAGSPEQHEACVREVNPELIPDAGVLVDAGVMDAGVGADAGVSGVDAGAEQPEDPSGCTASPGQTVLWPMALLLLARRRRRSGAAATRGG